MRIHKEEPFVKLFETANRYCKEADWKTLSMLKICLLALGMCIGVLLPASCKTVVLIVCAVVFAVTVVPLMGKFLKLMK